jgi:hypothetical protein
MDSLNFNTKRTLQISQKDGPILIIKKDILLVIQQQ